MFTWMAGLLDKTEEELRGLMQAERLGKWGGGGDLKLTMAVAFAGSSDPVGSK